jgi:hypothetical protein
METVTMNITQYNKYLRNEELVKEQAKQIHDLLKNSKPKVVIETIKKVEYFTYFDVLQNAGTTTSYKFIELDDFISEIKSPYIESLKNGIKELESEIARKASHIGVLNIEYNNMGRQLEKANKELKNTKQDVRLLIENIINILETINIFNMKKRIVKVAELLNSYITK